MAKLEIDVPLFKRCCFCLPLRYGLFALGIMKLYLFAMIFSKLLDDFTGSPMAWLLGLGIMFNVLLITAAIMNNERLYNIYYKCAIVEILMIMIMFAVVQIHFWNLWSRTDYPSDRRINKEQEMAGWVLFLLFDSLMLLGFFIQGYVTLLVKSALIQLREAVPSNDNTVELEPQSVAGKSVEV